MLKKKFFKFKCNFFMNEANRAVLRVSNILRIKCLDIDFAALCVFSRNRRYSRIIKNAVRYGVIHGFVWGLA